MNKKLILLMTMDGVLFCGPFTRAFGDPNEANEATTTEIKSQVLQRENDL